MELGLIDLALLGGIALIMGIGFFRGLSGELASFAGFVAAVASGCCLYGFAHVAARAIGFNKGDAAELMATGVTDFLLALIAFGLARWLVEKFVSFLVPQPTNALLGGVSAAFKCLVGIALLAGVGFLRPGTYAQGYMASRSMLIGTFAKWADSYCSARQSGESE